MGFCFTWMMMEYPSAFYKYYNFTEEQGKDSRGGRAAEDEIGTLSSRGRTNKVSL